MRIRRAKAKAKEIEHISFAVSYALTSAFIEKNQRNPTEEEIKEIKQKNIKYVFEIVDHLNII